MRSVPLTKVFRADQFERALESWDWIGIGGRKPVFCSLFGDVRHLPPGSKITGFTIDES